MFPAGEGIFNHVPWMILNTSASCLAERNSSGLCKSWFSQYPVFQAPHKSISELIETCYLGTQMTNPQMVLRVSTTSVLPYRGDQIWISLSVSGGHSSWKIFVTLSNSLGENVRVPQFLRKAWKWQILGSQYSIWMPLNVPFQLQFSWSSKGITFLIPWVKLESVLIWGSMIFLPQNE